MPILMGPLEAEGALPSAAQAVLASTARLTPIERTLPLNVRTV
jgi:hypothetical protein